MQPLDTSMDMDIDDLVPPSEDISPEEREHRRNAIKKFMERKKVAQLTEQLRMRLSYASFKASRGYSSLPFSKLDPLVDQEIAARSPSPSVSSTMSGASGVNGRAGRKVRGRPNSYTAGAPIGLGMKHLNGVYGTHGSISASASPALDQFPPDVHALPAPGSLYMALFGSAPLGSNGFSPIKHSPTLSQSPKGIRSGSGSSGARRKRASGAAGSVPPPDSPRKHRRTTGSASFSHPPRSASSKGLQREAAEAAAILTSFLSSQESAASPHPSQGQSQSTRFEGSQSQGTTLVDGRMSRTSSGSSAEQDIKPNGLGAPFSDADVKPPMPSTPPRISTAQAAMPAMDAAETLVWLATSPSPARPPKNPTPSSTALSGAGRVLFAPTTPVQAHHSRSQSTPNGHPSTGVPGSVAQAQGQSTPFGFSFADFVNVSPSPAQPAASAFRTGGGREGGVAAEAEALGAPPGIY